MVRIRRIVPALMSACLAFSAAGAVSSSGQTAWGAQAIQYSDLPELVKTYSPHRTIISQSSHNHFLSN